MILVFSEDTQLVNYWFYEIFWSDNTWLIFTRLGFWFIHRSLTFASRVVFYKFMASLAKRENRGSVGIFHTNPISLLARPDDVRKALLDIAWANLTRPVSRVIWLYIR